MVRRILALCGVTLLAIVPSTIATPPAGDDEDLRVLKTARVGTEGAALLDYFRKRTLTPAQRGQIRLLIPRLGDEAFAVREQASLELMALGPAAMAHLRAGQSNPDEEIKERLRACIGGLEKKCNATVSAAAARRLRRLAPAEAVEVLLSYLADADTEEVIEEVLTTLAALGVREGKVAPTLVEALKDRDVSRRAAAALVVGRSGDHSQQVAVQGLLIDASFAVRFRAAQGLLAARDHTALPALIVVLADGPPPLAARADELLRCVAGSQAPRVVFAEDKASRRRCAAAWTTWWRINRKIDLSHADVDLPAFNLTWRFRRTARQFVLAFLQGDTEQLGKLVGFPFLFNREQVLNQGANVDEMLLPTPFRDTLQQNPHLVPSVFALRSLDQVARPVTPAEGAFLTHFRKGEVRVLEVLFPSGLAGVPAENVTVLVRRSGEQMSVVGTDINRLVSGFFAR
jgi:hypothetical protein